MILKVDIGLDEVNDQTYQIAVYDNKTGEVICHVYGKTAEQCEQRANDLVYSYNVSEVAV